MGTIYRPFDFTGTLAVVPEPTTLGLVAIAGLGGIVARVAESGATGQDPRHRGRSDVPPPCTECMGMRLRPTIG